MKRVLYFVKIDHCSLGDNFTEGYCWTRTGERQAARMRARYLKAVLRQDVGYFDLHVTSTSEVITSVSSDSLVIQDALSEKVRNILKYTSILGNWRLIYLIQCGD